MIEGAREGAKPAWSADVISDDESLILMRLLIRLWYDDRWGHVSQLTQSFVIITFGPFNNLPMKLFSEFPRVEKGTEFHPFSWWSISAVINACRELSKALSDPTLRPLFAKITYFVWVMTQCWTHLLFSWLCPWSKSWIPLWLTSLFLFQGVPRARCRVMALSFTSHTCDCGHSSWPRAFFPNSVPCRGCVVDASWQAEIPNCWGPQQLWEAEVD